MHVYSHSRAWTTQARRIIGGRDSRPICSSLDSAPLSAGGRADRKDRGSRTTRAAPSSTVFTLAERYLDNREGNFP